VNLVFRTVDEFLHLVDQVVDWMEVFQPWHVSLDERFDWAVRLFVVVVVMVEMTLVVIMMISCTEIG